ncbi:MAG: TetR/AcrR family transcriptional regulator [Gemmatimonadales bacterium]
MQDAAATRDRLVSEACTALGDLGLGALTVGAIARRAGVSTALVYYHFDTKDRLLLAAAARLAPQRAQQRLDALARKGGLDSLDLLWDGLETGVASGRERAWSELLLHANGDPGIAALLSQHRTAELGAVASRAPGLLSELGANLTVGAEEFALLLVSTLDGLSAALQSGIGAAQVRAAYDAFWLTTISAGLAVRR